MSEARTLNPRVIVRPATRNVFTAVPFTATKKRRVAAYARVSTDSDEQYTSYVAQVDYLEVTPEDIFDKIQMFKEDGCTLFK